jgi:hypothetical protein
LICGACLPKMHKFRIYQNDALFLAQMSTFLQEFVRDLGSQDRTFSHVCSLVSIPSLVFQFFVWNLSGQGMTFYAKQSYDLLQKSSLFDPWNTPFDFCITTNSNKTKCFGVWLEV